MDPRGIDGSNTAYYSSLYVQNTQIIPTDTNTHVLTLPAETATLATLGDDSGFVTLTTSQTISGQKRFLSALYPDGGFQQGSNVASLPTLTGSDTLATLNNANAFTSANNTFNAQLGITYGSFTGILLPPILTSNQSYQLPNSTGAVVLDVATQTLSNKTLTNPTLQDGSSHTYSLPSISVNDTIMTTGTVQTVSAKKTFTANPAISGISQGGGVNTLSFPTPSGSDTLVALTTTDVLSNKTLTQPTISTIFNGGILTLPSGTDNLVSRSSTDTLTNKTLDKTCKYGDASGGFTLTTPTVTANDVLVSLTATQTLTHKTLTTPVISSISNTGTLTLPTSTDTLVGKATTDTLTNKTLSAPTISGTISGALTTASNISSTGGTVSNANGTLAGIHMLSSIINNASGTTLTFGTGNGTTFTINGSGTPAVPSNATAALVTITGTCGTVGTQVLANSGTSLNATTNNNHMIFQCDTTGGFMSTFLVGLNGSQQFTVGCLVANVTSCYVTTLAWFG